MSKTMLIDAAHPEETRVVVLAGNQIDDFDFESQAKKQIRGNIYLAKVTRVEPSLQAGFVDYGGNRHGFLAFGEIHPDYYQIPAADREAILAEEAAQALSDEDGDGDDEAVRARRAAQRRYKIQEVIRRRQIMLVQAVKEERGNKGAALTTYLSLAGRYCVLMPNTPRGGGISRKISTIGDRKRLKTIVADLDVPKGMGLIIRTAGAKRTKTEIKRDYEYLLRLWDDIRERTMASTAPCLIHEEDNLVKRAVRDLYDKDVDAILVEGEAAFTEAFDFMTMLMPSHATKVQLYTGSTPLFSRMKVESHLDSMHSPIVQLRSGGYIVINQTEALVAIDVNSGRSTRERSIESTALKTNIEAADEAARQMRLRDLAGLVVIDFIDMEENRNDRSVEKRMKDALRFDRARVQMGKISAFGLLEISRQRRRTGVLEGSSHICAACDGVGRVRSPESASLQALRAVEAAVANRRDCEVALHADLATALYLLNEKRDHLSRLFSDRGLIVRVFAESDMNAGQYRFEIVEAGEDVGETEFVPIFVKIDDPVDEDELISNSDENDDDEGEDEVEPPSPAKSGDDEEAETGRDGNKRRRRRRRGRRDDAPALTESAVDDDGEPVVLIASESDVADTGGEIDDDKGPDGETAAEAQARRRRRRGRRGGRRRRETEIASTEGENNDAISDVVAVEEITQEPIAGMETISDTSVSQLSDTIESIEDLPQTEAPPKRKRPTRKKKDDSELVAETPKTEQDRVESDKMPVAEVGLSDINTKAPKKPSRSKRVVKTAPVTSEATSIGPDTPNLEQVELVVTEPMQAEPGKEQVPEAIVVKDDGADAGPKRSGWWSRNAAKLFGV